MGVVLRHLLSLLPKNHGMLFWLAEIVMEQITRATQKAFWLKSWSFHSFFGRVAVPASDDINYSAFPCVHLVPSVLGALL